MRGLIIKDVLVARKTIKTYVVFLLGYLFLVMMGFFDIAVCVSMGQVVLMMIPITAFTYDEAAKWNRFSLALPVSRRMLVGARYGFLGLITLCITAYNLLIGMLFLMTKKGSMEEIVTSLLMSVAVGLFYSAFMIPLCYKLGPERARPFMFILFLLPVGVILLFSQMDVKLNLGTVTPGSFITFCVAGVLVGLLAMLASYLISCRIVERQEF